MLHRAGSSPLTRGKHSLAAPNAPPGGLIPAHAGKTRHTLCPSSSGTAHPRSRGENDRRRASTFFSSGSSPLTRGKRATRCARRVRARLIPAHAGKTQMLRIGPLRRAAHPRSRGENGRNSAFFGLFPGSSPLTRGKRCQRPPTASISRLIPAHAGKTPRVGCAG